MSQHQEGERISHCFFSRVGLRQRQSSDICFRKYDNFWLVQHPGIEVIQLPGIIRKTSSSVTGNFAEEMLSHFSFSKLFLGVDGIDLEFGLTTTNMMEAQLNKKMIAASQKTIVLADSSKFGKRGFGRICGLEDIEHIITDSNISEHLVDTLKGLGIEVTIV